MARRRIRSPARDAPPSKRVDVKENCSEVEASNSESQQLLALGSLLEPPQNSDNEVQRFRGKVATDKKQLGVLLERRIRRAMKEETQRKEEFSSAILEALETPNSSTECEVVTYTGTRIATNAAYNPVSNVISASERLLNEYGRLNTMITTLKDEQTELPTDKWTQDLQDTEKTLEMGARVALRKVKKVIGADAEVGEDFVTKRDAPGDIVRDEREGEELNYDFQKSLRYAKRGVRRMVKGLPADAE